MATPIDKILEKKSQPAPSAGSLSQGGNELIYKAFLLYFGDAPCTKMNGASDQHSTYVVKVYSLLAETRYLVIITTQDMLPKYSVRQLRDLKWLSFQTRVMSIDVTLHYEHHLPAENNGVFDDMLVLMQRSKEQNKVTYQCRHNPLTVELIPTKKGSIYDYPDSARLESALETFHCVVYFS
jgi:hypothetical protein